MAVDVRSVIAVAVPSWVELWLVTWKLQSPPGRGPGWPGGGSPLRAPPSALYPPPLPPAVRRQAARARPQRRRWLAVPKEGNVMTPVYVTYMLPVCVTYMLPVCYNTCMCYLYVTCMCYLYVTIPVCVTCI